MSRYDNAPKAWPVSPKQYPLSGPTRGPTYTPPPRSAETVFYIACTVMGILSIGAVALIYAFIAYFVSAN